MPPSRPTVVLVHGGFVDGSGWQGVYDLPDGRRATPSASSRTRRSRSKTTSP